MFRRRRKRGGAGSPGSQPGASAHPASSPPAPAPVSPTADAHARARQRSMDALRVIVQRAAEMVKGEVASTGKTRPLAIFVYENETGNPEVSTAKMVSLAWRDELQKEALIRRIREKASMERAAAVLILSETEPESRSSSQRQVSFILSGAARGASLSARIEYVFDKETKSITSWDMRWLKGPAQTTFLDHMFPAGH